MNALDDLLRVYNDQEYPELTRRDLLIFAVEALKEVHRIEAENTGSPGKAAIEMLLNTKYEVVTNRELTNRAKDVLLNELDTIINKVVSKYHINRKGKNFYFDESLAIVNPMVIGPVGSDLLADLYAANTELETLRIQLAKSSLNTSDCLRLKAAVLDQEAKIKDIKLAIVKQKYFSHVDDQNCYNQMYRRSLGENYEI